MNSENLIAQIEDSKRVKNAIILAHNYQSPDIYDVADFVGDSFELAKKAQSSEAKIIVFCGVKFMAESAKILNPSKKVLLPDLTAGCPLADCIDVAKLREEKKQYPKAKVVCYVNSSAEVKAESDVCCTSANALKICEEIESEEILFIPDFNLGEWVGENLPHKKIIHYKGSCITHAMIRKEKVLEAQKLHPEALTLTHPECSKEIREISDAILGTGGMVKFVKESDAKEFLIATENGMLEKLRREASEKKFFALGGECVNMKKITLEKVLHSLEEEVFAIEVEEGLAQKAKRSLEKMIELHER